MLVSQVNITSVFPWQFHYLLSAMEGELLCATPFFFALGASLSAGHGWADCSLSSETCGGTNAFWEFQCSPGKGYTKGITWVFKLLYTSMQARGITSPGKEISNSLLVLEDNRPKILLEPRNLCNSEKFSITRQILPSLQHFEELFKDVEQLLPYEEDSSLAEYFFSCSIFLSSLRHYFVVFNTPDCILLSSCLDWLCGSLYKKGANLC